MNLKEHLKSGVIAGVVWGWLAYLTNAVTGVFPFEGSFAQDIVSFSFGGAVFGVATGASLALLGGLIPFRGIVARAVFASAFIWIVLRLAGDMLSMMEPHRYHLLTAETVQGLALAVALGAILGIMVRKAKVSAPVNA
ncbi:MAG: hypothetical protein A2052_09785 [Deltaproteobacteria bacterium GWA2_54_12]|nr:MAG: hypothetical protein A2052_09785 [Deltaproteobacteria bacterium GWA2_54_12]